MGQGFNTHPGVLRWNALVEADRRRTGIPLLGDGVSYRSLFRRFFLRIFRSIHTSTAVFAIAITTTAPITAHSLGISAETMARTGGMADVWWLVIALIVACQLLALAIFHWVLAPLRTWVVRRLA
jgi:hypothetical protein